MTAAAFWAGRKVRSFIWQVFACAVFVAVGLVLFAFWALIVTLAGFVFMFVPQTLILTGFIVLCCVFMFAGKR